ncbi:MAG: archaetidylserine decarboxylase [Proteobacteria bacterium]|nr:archaetidylserine decarboxylase [Pseudomonadota bacterium]
MTTGTRALADRTFAERLNFLVTNRLPRRWLTLFVGRFSRIENPVVRSLSIGVWRLFVDDLRLYEAKKRRFGSLHDCFVRELRDGARPIDPDPDALTSPCDAVVGEHGTVKGGQVLQAKGFPYTLGELLGDERRAQRCEGMRYVTLRLKSSMYHRFHSPCDARMADVRYISGDTWNVNPVALKTIERLFCRNERAVIRLRTAAAGEPLTIVAVAAILVASMRIHGIDGVLNLEYAGPTRIRCERRLAKGEEIGYFEQGSTLVLFVPPAYLLAPGLAGGDTIRMGRKLFVRAP